MNNVLVIRPLREAKHLSDLLNQKNIKSSLYPLFKPRHLPLPPFEKPQALIITSKNALKTLESRDDLKSVPLYVVGSHTAYHAKNMGFTNVLYAAGSSHELIHSIRVMANPEKGPFVHLSGEKVTGRIVENLKKIGFDAKRYIVYKIEDAKNLPSDLINDLKIKSLSHVMFFSPRTTSVFVNLLKEEGLEETTSHMISLCLSKNVAEKAEQISWGKLWISPVPTAEAIIGYFDGRR